MLYSELSFVIKEILATILFLLEIFQVGYVFLLFWRGKRLRMVPNVVLAIVMLALLVAESMGINQSVFWLDRAPVITVVLISVGLAIYLGVFLVQEIRESQRSITKNSIKEAVDHLPAGVCFFGENGRTVLCNLQMHELMAWLTGHRNATLGELREVLEEPEEIFGQRFYPMPDGTVWRVEEFQTEQGVVQMVATNDTDLVGLQRHLQEQNQTLGETLSRVQQLLENTKEIVRQREILHSKMKVHNTMGNCMLYAKQFLRQDMPKEKKVPLISVWRESLAALAEQLGERDEEDAAAIVIAIAKDLGVDVEILGEFPEDPEISYLLVIGLRECVTNAVQHAGADRLTVDIRYSGHWVEAIYGNNGRVPKEKIVEGGGLTSLREKVKTLGGTMEIQSEPRFLLTIKAPRIAGKEDAL